MEEYSLAERFPGTVNVGGTARLRLLAVRASYPPGTFTCNHLDMPALFDVNWDAVVAKDCELTEQARSDDITRAIRYFLLEDFCGLAPRSRRRITPRTWEDIV